MKGRFILGEIPRAAPSLQKSERRARQDLPHGKARGQPGMLMKKSELREFRQCVW